MPVYQYQCEDCSDSNKRVKKSELFDQEHETDGFAEDGEFIFYKTSSMKDKQKSPKCPVCGGTNTIRSYRELSLTCYVRGDGLVKDRSGARRDMNRHHLINQDPYGHMRQSGEVDNMLDRFRDSGRDMGKVRAERAKTSQETKERAKRMGDECLNAAQEQVLLKMSELGEKCLYSDLNEVDDLNAVLSSLMPDYVYKRTHDSFGMMAAGRAYVDRLINPD